MKNQKGFTLIEMLIVLTVITTLLILLIPNLASKNEDVQVKGCNALKQLTENQLQAYVMDNGTYPNTISTLVDQQYIQTDTCSNGKKRLAFDELGNNEILIVDNEG
ncbi:ComG operon protein 3 precursor [Paraliobacillus sp. PM-2]|uniref:competence type IV pilus major pilin ComGC n=1 Tax=Paraliobacillus sp. PM-2 TaxID=1462524 RepID=UPI00061C46A9|nr:competence type IV pilus major pilin ComGC [Paraliobacillus sp. PM-2]CQR46835.1 ComG operon protein 3 precursor [Paraliobacillus sp. PM-2]